MDNTTIIWQRFLEVVDSYPDKVAIVEASTDKSLNYRQLRDKSFQFSNALKNSSIPAVVMIGEPDIEGISLILACAFLNKCFIPISETETPDNIQAILSRLPTNAFVVSNKNISNLDLHHSVMPGKLIWHIWSKDNRTDTNDSLFIPFLVTHSSGSTGLPKPIAFSQLTKFKRTQQSIKLFNITSKDVILSASPFHHSLGQRHFFLSLLSGCTLVKAFPFVKDLWLSAVQKYQPTIAIPVSTHLKILKNEIIANPLLIASFRLLVSSSAPAEPDFKIAILDKATFDFWEIYGMTETACVTSRLYTKGEDTLHLGAPISGTKIRIAHVDNSSTGEIEVLSDCLCDGYWGDEIRWKNSLTADGYFKSGDLGQIDSNGHLSYLGRTNESFQSAGHVIYPSNIEHIVQEFAGIKDCVAFGVPDPYFSNTVGLVFTSEDGVTESLLAAFCREKLPKYSWPYRIIRLSSLPMLSSGKVDRLSIVKTYAS